MPVPKHKPITSSPVGSTSESSSSLAPEQEEFRQHLRRLAVSAVQVLLEQVMREELEQCIGASWGECTPTRRGYRNGSYTRDLVTPTGRIEDLKVPRDRAAHGMRNEIPIFQANKEKNEWERRTNMRKLWVKAWMTLDGVFDAVTMDLVASCR